MRLFACIFCCLVAPNLVLGLDPDAQIDPANRQVLDFKLQHKKPIGLLTETGGEPVDITLTNGINVDFMTNQFSLEQMMHVDHERLPERVVHAKGAGALGYFELFKDLSNYTIAEFLTGSPGKKTPLHCRFSSGVQSIGGSDLEREQRGMAVKFYTKEGNLDLLSLHVPVFLFRDPIDFNAFSHSFKRNPVTYLIDWTQRYDFVTLRPATMHSLLWQLSDYGIPRGYRRMDGFNQHGFEFYNKHGDKHYIRINFRTDQGLANFTNSEAAEVKARNFDYFIQDLYNAIEKKNYPSWTVELYIISEHDLKHINFDPFDLTRLWPEGAYKTINVGRIVLNENIKNFFSEVEQSAYNPAHLVPGIGDPPDALFRARRLSYLDSIRNRLGINFDKIDVNCPKYAKYYHRDGRPPTRENGKNSPTYFPNSFHGLLPKVDEAKPRKQLHILESNAIDFGPVNFFYNHVLKTEAERQRLAETAGMTLVNVVNPVRDRALKMYSLVDEDLGKRVAIALEVATARARARAARNAVEEQAEEKEKVLNIQHRDLYDKPREQKIPPIDKHHHEVREEEDDEERK